MSRFQTEYEKVTPAQQVKYKKMIQRHFKDVELSDDQKRYLLWLTGLDHETMEVFGSIFDLLKD